MRTKLHAKRCGGLPRGRPLPAQNDGGWGGDFTSCACACACTAAVHAHADVTDDIV